jgi:hypothetical protein
MIVLYSAGIHDDSCSEKKERFGRKGAVIKGLQKVVKPIKETLQNGDVL